MKCRRQELSLQKYCLTWLTITVHFCTCVHLFTVHLVVFKLSTSLIHLNWFMFFKSASLFYLHLEFHSITIFYILPAAHLTGYLLLIHGIVPENISLPFSCPNCVTAIIWNVIALEHVCWRSPHKLSCRVSDPQ